MAKAVMVLAELLDNTSSHEAPQESLSAFQWSLSWFRCHASPPPDFGPPSPSALRDSLTMITYHIADCLPVPSTTPGRPSLPSTAHAPKTSSTPAAPSALMGGSTKTALLSHLADKCVAVLHFRITVRELTGMAPVDGHCFSVHRFTEPDEHWEEIIQLNMAPEVIYCSGIHHGYDLVIGPSSVLSEGCIRPLLVEREPVVQMAA
ncbi:hypothetical protein BDK51DRAFT_48854 [Blyttiomyces helicus]|uniref:Uncharacterized protein n=1 Tax=Blyttiomyces helicus TaxID=388810 RepID=A0A4P9WFJ0_9FUNG|nr:hypothetical protein BDK51DRAFT_48854 [Blyttiomyces helicus]|eukprot:RKO90625.1 hypothetical protein BDK51DRAFT_48854 [Blyttiomyces helicus]